MRRDSPDGSRFRRKDFPIWRCWRPPKLQPLTSKSHLRVTLRVSVEVSLPTASGRAVSRRLAGLVKRPLRRSGRSGADHKGARPAVLSVSARRNASTEAAHLFARKIALLPRARAQTAMQLRDIGASDIDDPFLPNSGRTYLSSRHRYDSAVLGLRLARRCCAIKSSATSRKVRTVRSARGSANRSAPASIALSRFSACVRACSAERIESVAQARANRSDGKISRSDIDSRRSRATLSGGYNSSATTGAPSPSVILRGGRCVAGEVTEDEMRHDKRQLSRIA